MKAAFPREDATSIPPEERLPWREVEPSGPSMSRRVHPSEIDHFGHANHTYYLRWLEDHAAELFPNTTLSAIRMEYLADCKGTDDLVVRTAQHDGGYTQWIVRGEQTLMRAESRRRG